MTKKRSSEISRRIRDFFLKRYLAPGITEPLHATALCNNSTTHFVISLMSWQTVQTSVIAVNTIRPIANSSFRESSLTEGADKPPVVIVFTIGTRSPNAFIGGCPVSSGLLDPATVKDA